MATQKEMYELMGRALTDADFRTALTEDPGKAAADLGIDLTQDQAEALKSADLVATMENVDQRLSKARRP